MNITMAKARKLRAELQKKYKEHAISVELHFTSWNKEDYMIVYVEDCFPVSVNKHFFDIETVRKDYGLDGS